jgi:alpha/beta superfamily hydrolase
MPQILQVDIPASHGRLEGLLRLPDAAGDVAPPFAAVVCHPHPQFQGTMHNKVVFTLARALADAGGPALRFNFRGVGRSTGIYDDGRGESDDVRAALDWLAQRLPGAPLWLAGFSFGAWVGLPVGCEDPRVERIIGAGVPVDLLSVATLASCAKPKLIIQGEHDEYGPLDRLRPWFDRLPEPKELRIVAGATHFFTDRLAEVAAIVLHWTQAAQVR